MEGCAVFGAKKKRKEEPPAQPPEGMEMELAVESSPPSVQHEEGRDEQSEKMGVEPAAENMPFPAQDEPGLQVPHSGFLTYTRMYKFLIAVIIGLTVTNCVQAIGYHLLLPLKKIEPVYIALDMSSKDFVYKMIPLETLEGRESLAKYFLRNYVVARETVDRITEHDRVRQVLAMSTGSVFKSFENLMTNSRNGLYTIEGFKREIKVIRDAPVARKGADYLIHEVEFITLDTNEKKFPGQVEENQWNVKIAYRFVPQKVQAEENGGLLNPAGIQVLEYTVSKREEIQ